MPEKFYSVDEANALVPKLKPLLERIRATQLALATDKTVAAVKAKAAHNGGGPPGRPPSPLPKTPQRGMGPLQEGGIGPRGPSSGLDRFPSSAPSDTPLFLSETGAGPGA